MAKAKVKKKPIPDDQADLGTLPVDSMKFQRLDGDGPSVPWKELSDKEKGVFAKVLQDAGHPQFLAPLAKEGKVIDIAGNPVTILKKHLKGEDTLPDRRILADKEFAKKSVKETLDDIRTKIEKDPVEGRVIQEGGQPIGVSFKNFEAEIQERMALYTNFWQKVDEPTVKTVLENFYRHPEVALKDLQKATQGTEGRLKIELTALRQILEEALF